MNSSLQDFHRQYQHGQKFGLVDDNGLLVPTMRFTTLV